MIRISLSNSALACPPGAPRPVLHGHLLKRPSPLLPPLDVKLSLFSGPIPSRLSCTFRALPATMWSGPWDPCVGWGPPHRLRPGFYLGTNHNLFFFLSFSFFFGGVSAYVVSRIKYTAPHLSCRHSSVLISPRLSSKPRASLSYFLASLRPHALRFGAPSFASSGLAVGLHGHSRVHSSSTPSPLLASL